MEDGELVARAVATVGLGNALRAGDPAGVAGRIGTINLLVHVSAPLTDEALLEASAIATEAKAAAVLEAQITSRRTGRPATGTGTDCTVLACTPAPRRREAYAGKHTRIGALVGAAAHCVVREGVRRWLEENSGAPW
jgi:adenosylcobinamide amidohydrolase